MRTMRSLVMGSLLVAALVSISVSAQDAPLKVVATFSILGDVVQNIGGDAIALTTLVGPDADSHTFEPAPQDSVTLSEADIIFENGLNFESWIDDLFAASGSQAERVVVSQDITPGTIGIGDEAGETDPHIWQNPYHFVRVVQTVRDALIAADPANQVVYETNANAYLSALLAVDTTIIEQVQTLPVEQRQFVTNHDAFGYFATRFGFEEVGFAIDSVSTEGSGPSAADIAALVDAVRATGIRAVFPENIENADLINQVANEAGVIVGNPLCSDALSLADGPCPTYLDLLRYNADSIVGALS